VLATWAIVMHGGFIVNEDARRFADESSGYSEFAELILGQPCGTGWLIFDAAIDDKCRVFSDYERLIQSGAIKWADSIAELGRVTGLDADALQHTFDEVAGVHEGQPDVFGRQAFEQPLNPRYAAVHITGALFHTQGGLKVDAHAQVLSNDAPVAGVFAAGGAAVGISGHGSSGYLAGNGLLAALGLGRIAGVRAAALAGTVHAGGQR
jgi:fumarate reductase flavoprotein subunit